MPKFTLLTINSTYFTSVEVEDKSDPQSVLEFGVHGALMIASDEIYRGADAAAVEVVVEDAAGQKLLRSAVTVSVAPLAVGDVEQRDPPAGANDR